METLGIKNIRGKKTACTPNLGMGGVERAPQRNERNKRLGKKKQNMYGNG